MAHEQKYCVWGRKFGQERFLIHRGLTKKEADEYAANYHSGLSELMDVTVEKQKGEDDAN